MLLIVYLNPVQVVSSFTCERQYSSRVARPTYGCREREVVIPHPDMLRVLKEEHLPSFPYGLWPMAVREVQPRRHWWVDKCPTAFRQLFVLFVSH